MILPLLDFGFAALNGWMAFAGPWPLLSAFCAGVCLMNGLWELAR